MTRRMKRNLQIGSSAALLTLAPLALSFDNGLTEQQACAQTGTCCPESTSFCLVGENVVRDAYYKSEGPCKNIE